jgi:hypothetical protein
MTWTDLHDLMTPITLLLAAFTLIQCRLNYYQRLINEMTRKRIAYQCDLIGLLLLNKAPEMTSRDVPLDDDEDEENDHAR